jgi:hypothetical protein
MEKFIENNNLNVLKGRAYWNEAVTSCLAGLGCSIMPLIGVKNELNNGSLQIVPVKGLPLNQIEFNLLKKFSPVAAAYLDLFKMKRKNY